MIVNPGIRRFLGSAIQRLFNSASFYAPLTHSLVLERGTTATFTRATTATVRNNDGYLVTALSGEARFVGALRVRNLVATTSEDFSNAAWTKSVCSVTSSTESGPLGSTNATLITLGGGTTNKAIVYSATATAPAIPSFYFKAGTHKYVQLMNASDGEVFANFDLDLGVVGTKGTKTTSAIEDVGDGWYRVSALYNSTASLGTSWRVYFVPSASAVYAAATSSTGTVYIWGAQLEDVTAQTTQTAGEYVSVGVLSAPFHGSNVDGVKCFNTDISGNPIPAATNLGYLAEGAGTNLCLQSNAFTTTWTAIGTPAATQNVVGPDGATSAWTLTDNSAVALEGITQTITLTAAQHTLSILVKKTVGAQASYPVLFPNRTGSHAAPCTIDTSNGVATPWTAYTGLSIFGSVTAGCVSFNADYWRVSLSFLATAVAHVFDIYCAGTTNPTQSTGAMGVSAQGSAVFYGVQVELGSIATSYIATTTIAAARNADVLTYPSAGNASTTACTIYCEATRTALGSSAELVVISDGTSSNAWELTSQGVAASESQAVGRSGGGVQFNVTVGTATAGALGKYALVGSANIGNAYYNGTGGTLDTVVTAPAALTTIQIGDRPFSSIPWNGTFRNVRIWSRALSNSELQSITA